MIKKILFSIAGIFVLIVVYASTRPNTFHVQASQTIKAAPEVIFPYVNNLHAWSEWSPFEKDVTMKKSYSGPEEGVGASVDFDGSSGTGTNTIIAASPPGKIYMKLIMTKPLHCENTIVFTFTPQGDSTVVNWDMNGPVKLLGKLMGLLFSDEMVRKQFETGLSDLKTLVETKSQGK